MPFLQSYIPSNGITLHFVELGEGSPVLFCHGFPDTWRGWRRQMEAVAGAGYRAIALDMRGYGESSAPEDPLAYTPFHTVGDLVGLLDALDLRSVVIVGHDFGASVAWNAAMMRPDRFHAVFGVSVPFLPRGDKNFLQVLAEAGRTDFYMFSRMRPEADQEWSDARVIIPSRLYWSSGAPPANDRWNPFGPEHPMREAPIPLPAWLDAETLADTVADFLRTGFRGGLNYYRSMQLGFELSAPYKGRRVEQPSFFLVGEVDGLNNIVSPTTEDLRRSLPGLVGHVRLPGVGHWPQREAVIETNAALLEFLERVRERAVSLPQR
jgi:pimeloyl-ACP methyl ester carboxylesterase